MLIKWIFYERIIYASLNFGVYSFIMHKGSSLVLIFAWSLKWIYLKIDQFSEKKKEREKEREKTKIKIRTRLERRGNFQEACHGS